MLIHPSPSLSIIFRIQWLSLNSNSISVMRYLNLKPTILRIEFLGFFIFFYLSFLFKSNRINFIVLLHLNVFTLKCDYIKYESSIKTHSKRNMLYAIPWKWYVQIVMYRLLKFKQYTLVCVHNITTTQNYYFSNQNSSK